MRQVAIWLLAGAFAAWTLSAAFQLADGWARETQSKGPWANHSKVHWQSHVSERMLIVVLGFLSVIGLVTFAIDDGWKQRLRKACRCETSECQCIIDEELLYSRPNSEDQSFPLPKGAGG